MFGPIRRCWSSLASSTFPCLKSCSRSQHSWSNMFANPHIPPTHPGSKAHSLLNRTFTPCNEVKNVPINRGGQQRLEQLEQLPRWLSTFIIWPMLCIKNWMCGCWSWSYSDWCMFIVCLMYDSLKNISLISRRSFTESGRKSESLEKKTPGLPSAELVSLTRDLSQARLVYVLRYITSSPDPKYCKPIKFHVQYISQFLWKSTMTNIRHIMEMVTSERLCLNFSKGGSKSKQEVRVLISE